MKMNRNPHILQTMQETMAFEMLEYNEYTGNIALWPGCYSWLSSAFQDGLAVKRWLGLSVHHIDSQGENFKGQSGCPGGHLPSYGGFWEHC